MVNNILNVNHVHFLKKYYAVTSSNTTSISSNAWEEGTGLLSSLIPQTAGSTTVNDPNSFNTSKGPLKLGPVPLPNDLRDEAERVLKEQAVFERDPSIQLDRPIIQQTVPKGLVAPTESELLPHPPAFRTVDVNREVEKVRDARKRIRLDPQQLGTVDINSPQAASIRSRVLPSICAYTLHDVPDGYVLALQYTPVYLLTCFSSCAPCATFSGDNSLMAVGFSESYIRLWNLKGEKLKGLRSDFQSSSIKDSMSLISESLVCKKKLT
jgi:transcription initiation factor TFIID subunit 5